MLHAPERGVSVGAGTALYAIAVLLMITGAAAGAHARTLYVRVAGNDLNDGSSPALAVRTIGRAAGLTRPGDRVVVGPGMYREGRITPAAAAFARVSFVADRRGVAVGEPPGDVIIDGSGFPSGFELNGKVATTIEGFVIYGAGIGIYVKSQSDQAVIRDNVVCNNTDNGIDVEDSKNAVIFNNLVYNNARTGILLGGTVNGSAGARVINNTVYMNQNRGIYFTGVAVGSPNGLVINNIVQDNSPAGIQVNASSRDGYVSAANITWNNRYASGTPEDVTDLDKADPLFVNPAGPDLMLGGPHYADDDFHLQQVAAGQGANSPAVNFGTDGAMRLKLARASTRTDGRSDTGRVDAGYHYNNFSPLPLRPQVRLPYKRIYVSADHGDDTNDGTSAAAALQTVARAFLLAEPGNEVVVLPGRYREGGLTLMNSGKPGRDIRIHGGPRAVIDASICPCASDPMGCPCTRGILITERTNVTIDSLEVKNASDTGIEIRNGSTAITLRRCHLHDNGRRGLYVNGVTGITLQSSAVENNASRGVQIEGGELNIVRTSISGNPDSGLWALNSSTVSVSDSWFMDNTTAGILSDQSDVTVTGGTISGSKDGGARFTHGSTGTVVGTAVLNNIDVGVQGISSALSVSGARIESNGIGIQAFVDPVQKGSNQVTVSSTRVCGSHDAGIDAQDTAVSLTDVTLCTNGQEGLHQKGGSLQMLRGTVTQNLNRGISVDSADQTDVNDAAVYANDDNGIQIATTTGASVGGCQIYRNGNDGIDVIDSSSVRLWNNLVSGNHASGITIGGSATGSPNAQVLNNTIYGNANRGLLIGGSNDMPASQGPQVFRNIIAGNGNNGFQVNELSLPGSASDYNLNLDKYFPLMLIGAHDVLIDPQLVDPETGDFHLRPSSPAVDAGGMSVAAAGLQGTTTRSDELPDTGVVDLGYHYTP